VQSLSEIRSLLADRGLRPRRRLGQHFLHDHNQLRRLVDAAGIGPGQLVVEIGPGTGTLTETLADAGAEVIACEIDPPLAAIVRERLGGRITLIEGDCLGRGRTLAAPLVEAIAGRPFKLVANLPYQVASPLMVTLLLHHAECRGMWITIQKEVAERLAARPRTKAYGALAIIVQALATVAVIGQVPPGCFWPVPRVDSTIFRIEPRSRPAVAEPQAFARFVTAAFSKRRKQLGTIFGRDVAWPAGVTPDLRPDALTVEQLIALSAAVAGLDEE